MVLGGKCVKRSRKRKTKSTTRSAKFSNPTSYHRLEKLTVAQLPIHPQYLDVGTVYFAELEQPLEFGTEQITPQMAATINAAVPTGSVIRASLSTALSSATTSKRDRCRSGAVATSFRQ